MRRFIFIFIGLALSLFYIYSSFSGLYSSLTWAFAGKEDNEPQTFTAHLASLFKQALPDDEVAVKGPLVLKITLKKDAGNGSHILRLGRIHDVCVQSPANCEQAVTQHVVDLTTYYAQQNNALKQDALRIAVRPSALVAKARQLWGSEPMVARALAGDLWVLGMADQPTSIRVLKPADLKALDLNVEQALASAQVNTSLELENLITQLQTAAVTDHDIIGLTGDPYASSLLAFDGLWPDIAKAMDGHVIAMAPSYDVLLVLREDDDASFAALQKAGHEIFQTAQHPLSESVLRWSDEGWTVATP